jgi:drug/metabolite transporter (DMT)-like permease
MKEILLGVLASMFFAVIATTLFFIATNRVRQHQGRLAAVEATQSMQVLFVIIGEVLLLSAPLPNSTAIVGIIIIIFGVFLHSYTSKRIIKTKASMVPKNKVQL